MEQKDQAAGRASAQRVDATTTLPDGPNVGPSPYEHLAAQGDTNAAKPVPPADGQDRNSAAGGGESGVGVK